MSAAPGVDVLAILDSLIEHHDTPDSAKRRACIAARAAVAELIEAGEEVDRTEKEYWGMPLARNPERYAKAHDDAKARFTAAILAVRGRA